MSGAAIAGVRGQSCFYVNALPDIFSTRLDVRNAVDAADFCHLLVFLRCSSMARRIISATESPDFLEASDSDLSICSGINRLVRFMWILYV